MESELLLFQFLKERGFYDLRKINGKGVCAIHRFLYSTALCYGCDENGIYIGRYCFNTSAEARQALKEWTGEADPPGNWIKHKSNEIDFRNPAYRAQGYHIQTNAD
jgi:hypothetical protein